MDMQSAIRAAGEGRHLNGDEMTAVMRTIMTGEATPAQIGGFLVGLRMKGETVEEIAAAAGVMRELATQVDVSADHLVDTCGTGGDGASTFNVSTTSAFVVAGAGGHVAKHGNRSVSSQSGSADVLEAAGVNLNLTPERVATCIKETGVGFMFAPSHHSAMKHAIGPRREMGVRTIFNVLGPLTNPAGAPNQVIGVFSADLVTPLANVLKKLGSRHVMVVHADDGLDEISIASPYQGGRARGRSRHRAHNRARAVWGGPLACERHLCGVGARESGNVAFGPRQRCKSSQGYRGSQRRGRHLCLRVTTESEGRAAGRARFSRVRRRARATRHAGNDEQSICLMNPEPPDILKKIIRHKALEIGERSTSVSLKEMSARAERGPAVRPFARYAEWPHCFRKTGHHRGNKKGFTEQRFAERELRPPRYRSDLRPAWSGSALGSYRRQVLSRFG